jgi:hypothetical protein
LGAPPALHQRAPAVPRAGRKCRFDSPPPFFAAPAPSLASAAPRFLLPPALLRRPPLPAAASCPGASVIWGPGPRNGPPTETRKETTTSARPEEERGPGAGAGSRRPPPCAFVWRARPVSAPCARGVSPREPEPPTPFVAARARASLEPPSRAPARRAAAARTFLRAAARRRGAHSPAPAARGRRAIPPPSLTGGRRRRPRTVLPAPRCRPPTVHTLDPLVHCNAGATRFRLGLGLTRVDCGRRGSTPRSSASARAPAAPRSTVRCAAPAGTAPRLRRPSPRCRCCAAARPPAAAASRPSPPRSVPHWFAHRTAPTHPVFLQIATWPYGPRLGPAQLGIGHSPHLDTARMVQTPAALLLERVRGRGDAGAPSPRSPRVSAPRPQLTGPPRAPRRPPSCARPSRAATTTCRRGARCSTTCAAARCRTTAAPRGSTWPPPSPPRCARARAWHRGAACAASGPWGAGGGPAPGPPG